MKRWIGIDAGGSTIRIGLFDGTFQPLARFELHRQQLNEYEIADDTDLLNAALKAVNLRPSESHLEGIATGFAGYATASRKNELENQLKNRFPGIRIGVFSDAETAFAAAFGQHHGILSIHGTGGLVLARTKNGQQRFNGYGSGIGDVFSGVSLGRAGIRAALIARDAGKSTLLRQHFETFLHGTPELDFLIAAKTEPERIAAFTPFLLDAAQTGDEEASALLSTEATVFSHVISLLSNTSEAPVHLHGGLICHAYFVEKVTQCYHSAGFLDVRTAPLDACFGAIWLLSNRPR